jgi:polyhydroxyalkanoate synthase
MAASPFQVPDEFIEGFFKSGQSLMQAFGAAPNGAAAPTVDNTAAAVSLANLLARYWPNQMALWMSAWSTAAGQPKEPVVSPDRGDRRFHAEEWRNNAWYSTLKQAYLLNGRLLDDVVEASGLDPKTKHKVRFFTRQFIDSMSPANFAATNPEAIKLAFESQGESVKAGLANLLDDMKRGRISITDETAFEVGRNVATSEGAVVFENALFQLIQYAPLTKDVAQRPLVIVPPCINKFYILDLQPENSFVRFACEQGQTVFLVSWCNPGPELGNITWDDYVEDGVMKAIEVARAISRADKVNAVGWCVGGTILSSALAVMRARGGESVASLTLLTTMLDFQEPGDLGVFIDEQGVSKREQEIGKGGIYPGAELGFVFQTLRANDLIWPYVVGNYLKGKAPDAFDLLYWNADGTNLPGPMYAWYLRNMYLENNLCIPGRLTMCDTAVDLRKIDIPSYVLATQEDHIVPWRSAYRSTRLVGGESQFVLGASGHIAGVINPASKNKRSYWTDGPLTGDADQWLASAKPVPGSWWTHWMKWLGPYAGKTVPARVRLGNGKYTPIEPAPGRYVKVRHV